MKKILFTSLPVQELRSRVPFLRKREPWYLRYSRLQSPWIPAALIAPLTMYFVWKGAVLLLGAATNEDAE